MIVTFCGHAQISQSEKIEKWLYAVTQKLIEQGATTFYLGGYGAFDFLAASVLRAQKKRYPQIELIPCSGISKHREEHFRLRQHRVSAVGNYATPFCDFSQKSLDGRGQ